MKKERSELCKVLMNRDDLTEEEANSLIKEMYERVLSGENPEEILMEEGLEPDYIFDILY